MSELHGPVGVRVERRDIDVVVVHGILAGLVGGMALGICTLLVSAALGQSAAMPFRFASALVVGPDALGAEFPLAAAIGLGTVLHFALAAALGVAFVALLSLTFQLSARWQLLVIYGALFAFAVWEIDFLVAVPTFFGYLIDEMTVTTQLWNGILPYVLIYGPALGLYVARIRPGVVDDWRTVGPPAGTFAPPPTPDERRDA